MCSAATRITRDRTRARTGQKFFYIDMFWVGGVIVEITELHRPLLKQILQTGQGFPVQRTGATAQVKTDPASGKKSVSSKPVGHPISSHVRGADAIEGKTKFCSLDDQVEALWQLLNTSQGIQALRALGSGVRQTIDDQINGLFPVEAPVPGQRGARTFTTSQQTSIGINRTRCVAVLEGRQRGSRLYLHVHTCYPKLTPAQVSLLASAT